jgi:hypothetical protein
MDDPSVMPLVGVDVAICAWRTLLLLPHADAEGGKNKSAAPIISPQTPLEAEFDVGNRDRGADGRASHEPFWCLR